MRYLFFIIATLLYLPETSGCVPVAINHYAEPILPDYAGGTNTADRPTIHLIYDACQLFRSVRKDMVRVADGSSEECWGFHYGATIESNEKVCEHKCIYGISGEAPPKQGEPCAENTQKSTDINNNTCWLPQGSPLPRCAPDITMRYIDLCSASNTALGVCGRRSNFWPDTNIGSNIIDCFPSPVHPLPPAFCLWPADSEIKATAPGVSPIPPPINVTLKFCKDDPMEVPRYLCIEATNLGNSNNIHCEVELPTSIPVTGQSITINNCNWTQDDGRPFKLGQFKCIANGSSDEIPIYEDNYKLCLYDVPNNLLPKDVRNIAPTCQADDDGILNQTCVPNCGSDDSNPGPACAPCDKRLCVDMYPFEFKCENLNSTDRGTKEDCQSDIKTFCLERAQENNSEYIHFDKCIGSRNFCAKKENSGSAIDFGGKVRWLCKTVNKVLPGFTTPNQRYAIQPN